MDTGRIQCGCGSSLLPKSMKKHLKTRMHKKWEEKNPISETYLARAATLKKIIGKNEKKKIPGKSEKRNNWLQPSKSQNARMTPSEFSEYSLLPLGSWVSKLTDRNYLRDHPESPRRPAALIAIAGHYREAIWLDQLRRARMIARYMVDKGKKNLALMDGHGRFVFAVVYFLWCFDPEDLDQYSIQLYDIDIDVHNWHVHFIPFSPGREHVHGSIFNRDSDAHTVVYLNFCGLNGQYDLLLNYLRQQHHTVFVSFSLRGGFVAVDDATKTLKRTDEGAGMVEMIEELNNPEDFNYSVISQRGTFVTLEFAAL